MGLFSGQSQDETSPGVILFDDPALRHRNGKRVQQGRCTSANQMRDADAGRDRSAARASSRDPSAHGQADGAAPEQLEETERGRLLVVVARMREDVDPALLRLGETGHEASDTAEIVAGEDDLFDSTYIARHARSIAVGGDPGQPVRFKRLLPGATSLRPAAETRDGRVKASWPDETERAVRR